MSGWGNIFKALAWLLSIVATVFAVYLTDLFYKPRLLYTVTGFKIELPETYEKELSKIRAKTFMEEIEKQFSTALPRAGTAQPIFKDGKIGFERSLNIDKTVGLGSTKMRAEAKKIDQVIETLTNPTVLKTFLSSTTSYPTAFATVTIFNSGNREASDLDIEIDLNGILIESQIASTEPSIKEFDKLIDPSIALPVGLTTTKKRLVPNGYIELRLYWHMLPSSGEKGAIPSVTVKGTYSKGTLEKADTKPPKEISKFILIIGGLGLFLIGVFVGGIFLMKKLPFLGKKDNESALDMEQ